MANIAMQRIRREFKEVVRSDEQSIKLELQEDNVLSLTGYITGPEKTPYEGGRFHVQITIPETYPFNPPIVKFTTKLWHPNISSQTGVICLDILKDQWAAAMTLRIVLLSLQALLSAAEPDDPQDAVVANQYKTKHSLFQQTARFWAQTFAGAPGPLNPDFQKKIDKFLEVAPRADRHTAIQQLSNFDWNIDKAIEDVYKSD
ncbi:ubiquitin-conjugating enzyme E2 K [Galendromus occidentalis]|uniref:E2 ubiquitin-conjugating enzyme n=1 Tax=Galendromus occidentalis TaxID=34638 RepID=A0AAJ6QP69_9ACAR|nr:ubiquitin-conjugating enzyme E2 K [Galendromus occidentalis]